MLTVLRAKSQITIPGAIVNKLGIHEGDRLEITEKDGIIQMVPVAVYPKAYVEKLEAEISHLRDSRQTGIQTRPNQQSNVSKRFGIAKGKIQCPDTLEDFDRDNEEIANMLMGDL